ncbi:MAG: hypothetical protein ACREQF_00130, partial [Candidatus Binataceae bacterium]
MVRIIAILLLTLCVAVTAAHADSGPIIEATPDAPNERIPTTSTVGAAATPATGDAPSATNGQGAAVTSTKPLAASSTVPAIATRTKFSLFKPATWETLIDVSNFSMLDPDTWPFIP